MIEFNKPYTLKNLPDFFKKELELILDNADPNKGFQQKYYPENFSDQFKASIKNYLEEIIDAKIKLYNRGCLNITKFVNMNNECSWHNEDGVSNGLTDAVIIKGQYMCLFWLQGEEDKGGAFRFIDNGTGEVHEIKLEPLKFIVIDRYTFHSVEHYSGESYRVSYNMDFDIVS